VEHGANIFAKNYYDYSKPREEWQVPPSRDTMNKTPKEIAVKAGYTELAQYLQTKEAEEEKEDDKKKEGEKEKEEEKEGKAKDGPVKGRACFVADIPLWVDGKLVQISEVTPGQARDGWQPLREHCE
jgi:hypothetical protein